MKFIKIYLKEDFPDRENPLITNLKIFEDMKFWFRSVGLDITLFGFHMPFKEKNTLEVYVLDPNHMDKLDFITQHLFTPNKTKIILGIKNKIIKTKILTITYIPRVLKGYKNERVNKYKILTPIFFKDLFKEVPLVKDTKEVDIEKAKKLFTTTMINSIAKDLAAEPKEIFLEWDTFNITFSKCDIEQKNQLCAYGTFSTNCVPRLFIGDFKNNGCGRIVEIERNTELNIHTQEEDKMEKIEEKEKGTTPVEEQTANKSVAFSGKLRLQIEQKAAELGLTFEEFVKAQMFKSI